MRKLFGSFVGGRGAIGLLAVRLIFGAGLMLHGWGKIQHPFSWMGPDMPGFLQALAALSEFGGGLALIIGLLTPIAAFGIMCTMLYAMFGVHIAHGDPFVATMQGQGSYEPATHYLAVALLMLFTGPGTVSLDAMLFGRGGK